MNFKTYWAKNVEADVFGVSKNVSKYFEILLLKNKENIEEQAVWEASELFKTGNDILIKRLENEGILKLINENMEIAKENVIETQIQLANELFQRFNLLSNRGNFRFSEQYKLLRNEEMNKIELLNSPHVEKEIVYSAKDDMYMVNVNGDTLFSKKTEEINNLGRTLERDIFSQRISYYQDIDKKLVSFIYEVFGKKVASKYIKQWEKGIWGDKKQLPFSIKYDFSILNTELEKEKNVIVNKNRLDKIVKRNKRLSIVNEKNSGLQGRNRKGSIKKKNNFFKRAIEIIMEIIGLSNNSSKMLGSGKFVNDKMINDNVDIYNVNEYKNEECKSEKAYVTKIETITRKNVFESSENKYEVNNELIRTWLEKGKEQRQQEAAAASISAVTEVQKKQGLCIGNIININEPIAYSADSRDLEKNFKIGSFEWRPYGQYEINGISVIDKNNQIVNFSMNNKELNIKEFVQNNLQEGGRVNYHISYIMGKEKQPTGWVTDSDIYKLIKM